MNQLGTTLLYLGRLCRSIRQSVWKKNGKRFISRTSHVPSLIHNYVNVFFQYNRASDWLYQWVFAPVNSQKRNDVNTSILVVDLRLKNWTV